MIRLKLSATRRLLLKDKFNDLMRQQIVPLATCMTFPFVAHERSLATVGNSPILEKGPDFLIELYIFLKNSAPLTIYSNMQGALFTL